MAAADVLSIVTTALGLVVMGFTLWVRINTVTRQQTQAIADQMEAQTKALSKRIDGLQGEMKRIDDAHRDLKDKFADFRVEVSQKYAPVSRLVSMEDHIMRAIADIQASLTEIKTTLSQISAITSEHDRRLQSMENAKGGK